MEHKLRNHSYELVVTTDGIEVHVSGQYPPYSAVLSFTLPEARKMLGTLLLAMDKLNVGTSDQLEG